MAVRIDSPAQQVIAPSAERDGRWNVYTGVTCTPLIPDLNDGEPVRAVFDLATMTFAKDRTFALQDHDPTQLLGYWDAAEITAAGVLLDLHLTKPRTQFDAAALGLPIAAAAHIASGVPLEVSVGIEPGPMSPGWQLIAPGETIEINGRVESGDGDVPLYALFYGLVREASLLVGAADDATGRVAASAHPRTPNPTTTRKEPTVSDKAAFKALVKAHCAKHPAKHHPMIRALCTDGDNDPTEQEVAAAVANAELDDLKAQNKALAEDNARLKAIAEKNPADEPALDDDGNPNDDKDKEAKAASAAASTTVRFTAQATGGKKPIAKADQPEDLVEAMNLVLKDQPKLTGSRLRAEARRRYPDVPSVSPARAGRVRSQMATGIRR